MTLYEYIYSIRERSIAVLGIGVSNLPLIELLLSHGCDVTACDRRSMEQLGDTGFDFIRLGRKLIVNMDYVHYIDTARQQLILSDCASCRHELTASREVLAQLKAYIEASTRND